MASSMQAAMKELRNLKQEENTLMNLASKISDQLNRLKVEELALQNLVRLQTEELERKSRGSQRSINRSLPVEESDEGGDDFGTYCEEQNISEKMENEGIVPLNLVVNKYHEQEMIEEEEEDDETENLGNTSADDIETFMNSL